MTQVGVWLVSIFILLTGILGVDAMSRGAFYPGIAGIVGGTLCLFAGSRLKSSLVLGTGAQKLFGRLAAIAFIVVGIGVVYRSGFWVGFFGFEISGTAWCVIGLGAGYLFTAKKFVQKMDGISEVVPTRMLAEEKLVTAVLLLGFGWIIWNVYAPSVPAGTSANCAASASFVRDTCRRAGRGVSKAAALKVITSANADAPQDEKDWIQNRVDLIYESKAKGMSCSEMVSLSLQVCRQDEKK